VTSPLAGDGDEAATGHDDGAQAERTTMAWVRTALAIEATAVLAVRALHFSTGVVALGALTTVGVLLFVLTSLRGLHHSRSAVMAGRPARVGAPVAVSLLLVALCGAAGVLLVLDGRR
jgi:uncharacterized membrane protein YidH (DUF202 family)